MLTRCGGQTLPESSTTRHGPKSVSFMRLHSSDHWKRRVFRRRPRLATELSGYLDAEVMRDRRRDPVLIGASYGQSVDLRDERLLSDHIQRNVDARWVICGVPTNRDVVSNAACRFVDA